MKIKLFDIQNFRKLKSCRVELSDKETLFVGANNSGKTSAMDALIYFLVKSRRKELSTTDLTLSNWHYINQFALSWSSDSGKTGSSLIDWQPLCPILDVWLEVEDREIYYVSHLIPTLNWTGGLLGVRLSFEPKDIEALQKEYLAAYGAAQELITSVSSDQDQPKLRLWPISMRDFLERKLHSHFTMRAYLLDPQKMTPSEGLHLPQSFIEDQMALDFEPFDGLFRIDLIEAQRGFSDANAGEQTNGNRGNLSLQLRKYYQKHLDPSEMPEADDLGALQSIEKAKTTFDVKLKERFQSAISEIEDIGYPGFTDPTISLTSKINPLDGLDHDTAIQFDLFKQTTRPDAEVLRIPERLNGLGYKNLISMIFTLISFRDGWMRVGKASRVTTLNENHIEPLHLVLIEEPEAHLHAQVQQVFIRKAYDVLRKNIALNASSTLSTQLVVSTHSSYLAYEVDFSRLRYFHRKPAINDLEVPSAAVINLSATFGNKLDETAKFVTRYLKTTHCDLFFANGVILVEGAAERMLIPHFIRNHHQKLNSSYITILEINGSHAHRLRPLVEKLGLHTLVITDLDSLGADKKKVLPERNKNQTTNNDTLKSWVPCKEKLDDLMNTDGNGKVKGHVRVAYQTPISVKFGENDKHVETIPYTFEDALALSNIDIFKKISKPTGMLNKIVEALNAEKLETARIQLFDALKGEKAKMALDLIFNIDPEELKVPDYIQEGLNWLEKELITTSLDLIDPVSVVEESILEE